jgi:hypothetical protein
MPHTAAPVSVSGFGLLKGLWARLLGGGDRGAPQFLWRGVEGGLHARTGLWCLHAGQQFIELRYSKCEFGHECLAMMDK